MKLRAQISSETSEIELLYSDGWIRANVGGRSFDVEVSQPERNVYLLKHDGRIFQAFVSPVEGPDGETTVSINNRSFSIKLTDPRRLRSSVTDTAGGDGPAEIRASMPGKIVRTLVEIGSEVEKGQGIIVVEAMKMQNELKSPKRGFVKELRTSVGSTVSAGDILVTIE